MLALDDNISVADPPSLSSVLSGVKPLGPVNLANSHKDFDGARNYPTKSDPVIRLVVTPQFDKGSSQFNADYEDQYLTALDLGFSRFQRSLVLNQTSKEDIVHLPPAHVNALTSVSASYLTSRLLQYISYPENRNSVLLAVTNDSDPRQFHAFVLKPFLESLLREKPEQIIDSFYHPDPKETTRAYQLATLPSFPQESYKIPSKI